MGDNKTLRGEHEMKITLTNLESVLKKLRELPDAENASKHLDAQELSARIWTQTTETKEIFRKNIDLIREIAILQVLLELGKED